MRKVWKLFSVVLLVVSSSVVSGKGYCQGTEVSASPPALMFEKNEVDLGPVYIGKSVAVGFKFSNSGAADLVIEKIDSSCGCLVAEQPSRIYKPGEQGEITVQFDPSQAGTTGRIKKDIIVNSNDPSSQRQILSLRAFVYTIKDGVPYDPSALSFGETLVETSKTAILSIYEDSSGGLKVTGVEVPSGFRYSMENADSSSGIKYLIKVSNEPAAKIGPVSGLLKVYTNNKTQPVLEIPISLNVVGEITVEPSRLFLGLAKPGSEAQKAIRLSSSKNPFKVLKAGCDLRFLKVSHEPKASSATHTLTVAITNDAPSGRFEGAITVRTDNKYQPEIRILVFGTIADAK